MTSAPRNKHTQLSRPAAKYAVLLGEPGEAFAESADEIDFLRVLRISRRTGGRDTCVFAYDLGKTGKRLKDLKASRDKSKHAAALDRITADARAGANMMPALIEAAKADATVGEMMDAMKSVFGAYDGGPEW